jgi:hypothetical protein
VFVDPEGLPGIYMARVVATLEGCSTVSSLDANRFGAIVVNEKSPLMKSLFSPPDKYVDKCVKSDTCVNDYTAVRGSGVLNVGSGECLPRLLGDGAPDAATDPWAVDHGSVDHWGDLQASNRCGSLPVENHDGKQVDTIKINAAEGDKGQKKIEKVEIGAKGISSIKNEKRNIQPRTQVLGWVPIQIANLSLEEVDLEKQMYIGVASPVQISETQELEGYNISVIRRDNNAHQDNFEKYLKEKLAHLQDKDQIVMNPGRGESRQGLGSQHYA